MTAVNLIGLPLIVLLAATVVGLVIGFILKSRITKLISAGVLCLVLLAYLVLFFIFE